MKIMFFLLCASIIVADDFAFESPSFFMGKISSGQELGHIKCMASLKYDDAQICSAVLVSNKHALTTASCLKGFLNDTKIPDFNLYSLVLGRLDIAGGSTCFSIEQVKAHKYYKYNIPSPKNDVGLITLRDTIIETEYVGWGKRIEKEVLTYSTATLTVWENIDGTTGRQNFFQQLKKLNKIEFKILWNSECDFRQDAAIICALPVQENQTFSEKDLGAPLSQGNFIIGILAALPAGREEPTIFIDVYKSALEINILKKEKTSRCMSDFPRKRAKYNYQHKGRREASEDISE